MKQLKEYISEALVTHRITRPIRKHTPKTVQPQNKEELEEIIKDTVNKEGYDCDLNFIDTSLITDMSWLFNNITWKFHGDISEWDVSNVTEMSSMFAYSEFNGDISDWDVSNVKDMSFMFQRSNFNRDISEWDVSKVENMQNMFEYSKFNNDISGWDVSNVKYIRQMFQSSNFNRDISEWDVSNVVSMQYMFNDCPFDGDISKWYMPKLKGDVVKDMFKSCPLETVYTGKIDKTGHFEKL